MCQLPWPWEPWPFPGPSPIRPWPPNDSTVWWVGPYIA